MQIPRLSRRVLARLAEIEACESNLHYRDDLRIARLTVAYATNGEAVLCSPHVLASYMVLGLHPEKVWPAILARRAALGRGLQSQVSGSPPARSSKAPKKPAQSVKLWFQKTNAARVNGSRGAIHGFSANHDTTMSAASIAALYPKPDASHSGKGGNFSLLELKQIVGYSGAPDSICDLTLSALRARGEWPNERGPATTVLSVAILGMMLEGVCCRSTVQRRIKRAVKLGFWRRTRDANSWTDCPKCSAKRDAGRCGKCNYRGRSRDADGKWTGEFMRVPTYEFDVQKFRSAQRCREIRHFDARTYLEYKAAAKRGEHPNVTEMPARKATQPAPQPESIKAGPVADRDECSRPLNITRDVRVAIADCYANARKQGQDEATAIRETCKALSSDTRYLDESEVRLQLKIWRSKNGSLDPPAPRAAVETALCKKCGTQLDWNKGPGPRLVCPRGCVSS